MCVCRVYSKHKIGLDKYYCIFAETSSRKFWSGDQNGAFFIEVAVIL